MNRKVATVVDILGTLAFLLIFTPAFFLLTISMLPLAATLRFLRWWRERGA